MSAVPVPPVTDNERDAQTIRENVAHIARGCRAHTSHNPAVYEQAIDAALARLVAALSATTTERDEARAQVRELHSECAAAVRQRDAETLRANVMEHERDFEQQVVVPSAWDKIDELTLQNERLGNDIVDAENRAEALAAQLHQLSECVIHSWTEPAFCRGKLHDRAVTIARAALAAAAPATPQGFPGVADQNARPTSWESDSPAAAPTTTLNEPEGEA